MEHSASATRPGRPGVRRPEPTRGVRSRITVVDDERRVDLSVPTDEPVVEWLPAAIEAAGRPPVGPGDDSHVFGETWHVHDSVGGELDLSLSLGESGVRDGAALHLERGDVPRPEVRVSTVLGEIATTAPAGLTGPARVSALSSLAGVALLVALLTSAGWALVFDRAAALSVATSAAILAAVSAGGAAAAARSASRSRLRPASRYAALTAVVASVSAGALFARSAGPVLASTAAAVAGLLAAAVVWSGGREIRPVAIAAGTVLLPLAAAATLSHLTTSGSGPMVATALLAWTLLLPVTPRLCATVTRLVGGTGRTRDRRPGSRPDRDDTTLAASVSEGREAMAWCVVSISGAIAAAAPTLLLLDPRSFWSLLLVALSAVVVGNAVRTMTARLLATSLLACVLMLSGSLASVLVARWTGATSAALAGFAVPCAVLGVASWPRPISLPAAELLRALKGLDLLARISMLPALLGCFGVFAWAISLGTDLGAR